MLSCNFFNVKLLLLNASLLIAGISIPLHRIESSPDTNQTQTPNRYQGPLAKMFNYQNRPNKEDIGTRENQTQNFFKRNSRKFVKGALYTIFSTLIVLVAILGYKKYQRTKNRNYGEKSDTHPQEEESQSAPYAVPLDPDEEEDNIHLLPRRQKDTTSNN